MERAALSLAVSVVSPIFKRLEAKAASYFGGDITEEELQHLQNIILPKFQTVLSVAEAVPVHELKPWLRTLQAAAYEAEDVLDIYEYNRLKAQVSSLPRPFKKQKMKAKDILAHITPETKLKESMKKLRRSTDETDKLISLYGALCPSQEGTIQQRRHQSSTVSSPSSPIFGRDEERESLINMLISTTDKLSSSERRTPILAIYGIGGGGKTTLAQSVYNDSRVEKHFNKRMWVHVSRKFDAREVTIKIIESATKGGQTSKDIVNLDALQMKLKEILKSEKFLVVLDDVWCEDHVQWDQMLIPLNEVGGTESRILITTREEGVASKLRIKNVVPLKDLENKHYMSIFKYYALDDANEVITDKGKELIANHIVMKIKSPLSARIVGSLLWGSEKSAADWKRILKEDEMSKGTLDVLYLSFENLAPHLRRCFAFCSLYPKGYHFEQQEVNRLVKFWIAHGFVVVSGDDNMTIEDEGEKYFNDLLSHSFFQKETGLFNIGEYYYVIHDLLHDLAERVSKDHCFRIEDDTLRIPTTIMHLSISRKKDLSSNIKSEIFNLLNLRTFIIDKISEADFKSISSKIFEEFKKLRVLYLGGHKMSKLHKSVGKLKHLRYFQLGDVDRLPDSLGKLYHLQYLNIRPIEKVPESLNNLINLRGADDKIISRIPLFGRLTSLQNFEKYSASRKVRYGVGQLKNLQELRGSLHIDNLENVQDKAEASEASLNEKKFVEKLSLVWTCSPVRDGKRDEEVIDGLEPSPDLNEVRIRGYNGIELPRWLINDVGVSNPQFSSLSTLSIGNCPKLKQVPSLPSTLETVEIENCENLCEASSLPPGLRDLTVRWCPKLMQLCPFPPSLEELEIEGCPGVETLLADVLLFDSRDEQQHEKDDRQQHLQLTTLSIHSCSDSGGKKRHFGSRNNKLLSSLSSISLCNLPWLASLFLSDLTSLEVVIIMECENVELFGSSLASASSLKALDVMQCPKLTVEGGEPLLLPPSLTLLTIDDLSLLRRSRFLNALSTLSIEHCREGIIAFTREQEEELFPRLTSLRTLCIGHCPNLTSLAATLEKLSSLRELIILGCPKIESLPNLPTASLKLLEIHGCPKIESLPNLPASLELLKIEGSPKIESLPNLPTASMICLRIEGCHPQLKESYGEGGSLRHKVRHIPDLSIH